MLQHALAMLLLQLSVARLCIAAPLASGESVSALSNTWQYGTGGGVIGFIVLVLDIIVFIEVLQSTRPPLSKLLWCLVVFVFPIVGMLVYWLFSNRELHKRGASYEPLP